MKAQLKFEVVAGREQPLRLSRAILVYRGGGDAAFATVHRIGLKQNMPVILEGRALTPGGAVELARSLVQGAQRGGFVPPGLLYMDGDRLAWWLPPARRHVAFRASELGAPERGEVVPHPGLVFMVDGSRKWWVWAVKGVERPTEESLLYRAPYFNVWEDGGICVGNVALPDGTTAERIEAWNQAFFGSYFTHPNGRAKLVASRRGAIGFWKDMLDRPPAKFPERALVPMKLTLGEALAAGRQRHGG
jgi:PRTRC genetic system protein B